MFRLHDDDPVGNNEVADNHLMVYCPYMDMREIKPEVQMVMIVMTVDVSEDDGSA